MFKFKTRERVCIVSKSTSVEQYPGGPTNTALLITFDDGTSWGVPLAMLKRLVEPDGDDSAAFLDAIEMEMSPRPQHGALSEIDFDMIPKEDGGFKMRGKERRR